MTMSNGQVGRGSLDLRMGPVKTKIYGGPFKNIPAGFFGVCLQAEHQPDLTKHAWVPIPDFGVPKDDKEMFDALCKAIDEMAKRNATYVGCMGGQGRTGIFLALLVRVCNPTWSGQKAIEYVREHYLSHAVETKEQEIYVMDFELGDLPALADFQGWDHHLWRFWVPRFIRNPLASWISGY